MKRGWFVGLAVSALTVALAAPPAHASSSGPATGSVGRPVGPAHSGARPLGSLLAGIIPQSVVRVGNCIPFGDDVDFGFTGFIYRNVAAFTLAPGDTIAFDLGAKNDRPIHRDIYLAAANKNPDRPEVVDGNVVTQDVRAVSWVQVVSVAQTPKNPKGNTTVGDFELRYTAEAGFVFAGGGLIVGVGSGTTDDTCDQVMVTTTWKDRSSQFYARFCYKRDLTLGPLDKRGDCGATAYFIGGMVLRSQTAQGAIRLG